MSEVLYSTKGETSPEELIQGLTEEIRLLHKYCGFLKCSLRCGEHSAAKHSFEDFKAEMAKLEDSK